MNNRAVNKLVALPFIIAGIVFAVAGYFLYNNNQKFKSIAKETNATIIEINSEDTRVKVEFNADNKKYTVELSEYSSSMKVGGSITVYYDPSNPENVRSTVGGTISYIFMGLGIVVAVSGLFVMIKTNLKYRRYMNVESSGIRKDAKIVSVDMDNTVNLNGKNPYYVTCQGLNPISGRDEYFRSTNIWIDARKIIEDNHIEILPIYIDQNNSTNYTVDIKEIEKYK